MTMKKVNIFEAKAKLSEYVEAVQAGEQVIICNRNRPVAELRAITSIRDTPRPIGLAKGLEVPDAFFDPLPDDVVNGFDGDVPAVAPARVAERPPAYGKPVRRPTRRR
jgi:prevent-host-death family protein